MDFGRVASVGLLASGLAGVAMPGRVGAALGLTPATGRASAEIRAGLGGTYAALGAWALVTGGRRARVAVGVTWLGAAAARLASLALDEPETDWTFWAYLVTELALGSASLGSARRSTTP